MKKLLSVAFYFNPYGQFASAVDLTVNGVEHQTADIREWCGEIILGKKTPKANQKYLIVDETNLKYGYTRIVHELDADVFPKEMNGLQHIKFDREKLAEIINKITYKGVNIEKFRSSGNFQYRSQEQGRFLIFDTIEGVINSIDSETKAD